MKRTRVLFAFSMLSMMFVALYGCGGGSDSSASGGDTSGSSGSDGSSAESTTSVTETESQLVAAALVNASTQAFIGGGGLSLGNLAVPTDGKSILIKTPSLAAAALSVTETSYCTGSPLTDLSTLTALGTATMNGSDMGSDGRGTCFVSVYGYSDTPNYLITDLNYNEFSGGSAMDNVTLDGEMQLSMMMTQSENYIEVSGGIQAASILVGFIEGSGDSGSTRVCEVNPLELRQTSTYDISESSVTYISSVYGCMKVCDDAFNVSGSSSVTVSLPN
jgi:hypothetical protein